jgi:hypothetical protein
VNVKVLQGYLGHKNLSATEVYLHLTRNANEHARAVVDRLMNGPPPKEPDAKGDETEAR